MELLAGAATVTFEVLKLNYNSRIDIIMNESEKSDCTRL